MRTRASAALVAVLSSTAALAGAPEAGWIEVAHGLPEQGQWRNGFDLADYDGDGSLDLVHGPSRRSLGAPVIFLGQGGLDFARWNEASFSDPPFDYGDVAAADFNGDGNQDIALAIHLRGLAVLAGDGRGGFSKLASYLASEPNAQAFGSRAVSVADVDADGRSDIVMLGEGPMLGRGIAGGSFGLRVLLNRWPEPFEWRELQPLTGRLFGNDLAIGDFDADGHADLVTATSVQGQRGVLFWGDGEGGFQPAELGRSDSWSFIESVAAADLDGDGDDDLVLAVSLLRGATEQGGVEVLFSFGERTWQARSLPWDDHFGRPTAIAAGDVDGDGDPDLVALSANGGLVFFEGQGDELRPGPGLSPAEAGRGCRGYHVQAADLDGDGREELLAAFAGEECSGEGRIRGWQLIVDAPNSPTP